MLPRDDVLEVGRLRVRGRRSSSEHVDSLEVALRAVDLRPSGFRGSEVLLIRSLPDPAPGSVPVRRRATVPAAWEQAARERVAGLYRGAARPASGPVAGDADAVLFADPAELLVALALDWLAGRAGDRWWWATLTRGRPIDAAALARLMVRYSTAVPPMLRALADRGVERAVLTRLGPTLSASVAVAVLRAYGLEALIAELADPPVPDDLRAGRGAGHRSTTAEPDAGGPVGSGPAGDARPDDLPWPTYVLLAVSLGIVDGRSTMPTEALRARISRSSASGRLRETPSALGLDAPRARDASTQVMGSPKSEVRPVSRVAAPSDSDAATPSRQAVAGSPSSVPTPARAALAEDQRQRDEGVASVLREVLTPIAASAAPDLAGEAPAVDDVWPGEVAESSSGSPDAARDESFETAFGGVFYLVNVMTHLELPHVFEPGWRLASGAGAWQTLELLGLGLLDRRARRVADDPIWEALRVLDGRPRGVNLGAEMVRPRTRRLPRQWVDRDDPRGFRILTVASGRPPTGGRPAALVSRASPAAIDWVAMVAPFVRWRIARALGPGSGSRDVVAALRRPARVLVGATHVDLEISLKDISVPVRRAGLDLDPGWQPAFGRIIRFHFQ